MPSSTSHHASAEQRVRLTALWTGVLAGPVVSLVLLEANYALSYLACGTQHVWFLHAQTAIAALIVAAAGLWGWRAGSSSSNERERWMAWGSLALTAFSILLIAAFEAPISILKPCS